MTPSPTKQGDIIRELMSLIFFETRSWSFINSRYPLVGLNRYIFVVRNPAIPQQGPESALQPFLLKF
jgi:hypothetical protein